MHKPEQDGTTARTRRRPIVLDFPAQVCSNCREAYIDEKVTAGLLRDGEERASIGAQVEVQEYIAA